MGFYVRKGFNFGPLRVNFSRSASDCRWVSKGCVLVPDRTEILFMPAERAFIISRRFLKSAKAKICCVWAGLCWRFWRLWLPVFIFICKPAVILAWWKVCYGSNWQIGHNGKEQSAQYCRDMSEDCNWHFRSADGGRDYLFSLQPMVSGKVYFEIHWLMILTTTA